MHWGRGLQEAERLGKAQAESDHKASKRRERIKVATEIAAALLAGKWSTPDVVVEDAYRIAGELIERGSKQ